MGLIQNFVGFVVVLLHTILPPGPFLRMQASRIRHMPSWLREPTCALLVKPEG